MDLLQEYKDLYYKELDFKDTMSGKIGTSITLLTAIATGHIFMWNIMIELDIVLRIIPIIFFSIEMLSIGFAIISCYYFYKTYYKYDYRLISIEKIKQSIDNNMALSKIYTKKEIEQANISMLCDAFYEYAAYNRILNIRKSKYQLNLTTCETISIILLGITYVIWRFIISKYTF